MPFIEMTAYAIPIHFREEDHASNMYLKTGTFPMLKLPLQIKEFIVSRGELTQ